MSLRLQGEVSLDGSGWEAGMKRIEGATHHTAEVVKGLVISAFGVYGIEQAIHKTIEYGEHITDLSRMVGIGIEKLQEFGFAAKMNGLELDELATILERINKNRLDPAKAGSFKNLGIGTPGNTPIEDVVMKLHLAAKNRSAQELAGPLMDIGGKSAFKAIPMLKDDLEELMAEAHKLGAIMRTEDVVALKFMGDQMKTLAQIILVQLGPVLNWLFQQILSGVNKVRAVGTFLGTATADSHFWKDLLNVAMHPFTDVNDPKIKESADRLRKAKESATDAAGKDLMEMDEASAALMARLLSKQKEIEDINRTPDFDSEMKGSKSKSGKNSPYTDGLLRIGNFLGASQTPMERIAHEHTNLLRQIAHNTGMTKKQWGEKVVRDHDGFGHL